MATCDLTAARLRELLVYDPTTGIFTRSASVIGPGRKVGRVAGSDNGQGYIKLAVDGRFYRAHRLAFLYMTGSWPLGEVDHINGVRSDNRWGNLRDVSGADNTHNQRLPHKNNTSGFLGVRRSGRKFRAFIGSNNARIYLGVFDTPELAHFAYLEAKRRIHASCTI